MADPRQSEPGPGEPLCDETRVEVRYAETDQMGYAHHGCAVLWFELGRVRWLRRYAMSYGELEASGVLLPVVGLSARYHAPARFEDELAVVTRLAGVTNARITFENRILRIEKGNSPRTLMVSGNVELACVDRASRRLRRVPEVLQRLWDSARPAGQGRGSA